MAKSSQTDDPIAAGRPDHLYEPVPGDPGARGRFSRDARERSPAWWLTAHRGRVAAGALVAAGAGVAARWRR